MNSPSDRHAILVLGMHRSGTSALTRALSLCGPALPEHLIAATPKNERGYFESQTIYELHEELLRDAGTSWRDPSPFPASWFATQSAARWEQRLAAAVRVEYGDSPFFILKDPRLCRLVPLWLRVLAALDTQPLFALSVRDPLEVAASLRRSENVVEKLGAMLWLEYLLAAERSTRGRQRSFVLYADLLTDWRRVLAKISGDLQFPLPRLSRAAEAEVDAFLSPALRHQVSDPSALAARSDGHPWLRDAFEWARAAATGSEPDPAPLDAIRRDLDLAETAFGPVLAATELACRTRDAEIARLEGLITKLGVQVAEGEAQVTEDRRVAVQQRREVAATRETARVLLRWAIERGRGDRAAPPALRAALDAFAAANATEVPAIASSVLALTEQRLEIEQLSRDREGLAAQLEQLALRLDESEGRLRERDQRIERVDRNAEATRFELLRLQAARAREEQQVREISAARQSAAAEAQRLTAECRRWMERCDELANRIRELQEAAKPATWSQRSRGPA